jgi:hypothetical protein
MNLVESDCHLWTFWLTYSQRRLIIWLSNLLNVNIPDEGFSRKLIDVRFAGGSCFID